jgi:Protein of unknown function (DUF2889)
MSISENPAPNERRLCQRKKNVDVFLLPSGKQFRVFAEMQDSVHHMRINMVVDQPSLIIREIDCDMVTVPDELCRSALSDFDAFIGKRVAGGIMRDLKLSQHQRCTHLVDLFRDACYNIPLAQSQLGEEELSAMFPDITEEQLYNIFLWFKPDLENSCVRYASDSPFMCKLSNIQMPVGAEKLRAAAKTG